MLQVQQCRSQHSEARFHHMAIGRVPGATGIQPSIVDAKGDLIAATAADSVSRLAAGSNNQVLTADSAEATGLKYANGSRATLTTTGDILYASAANTPARLAIGSTDQVLKVSGGIPAWATPAAGGSMTQLVTSTSLGTGTQVNITSISQDYRNLRLIIKDWSQASGGSGGIRISLANTTDTGFGGTFYDYRNTLYGTRTNSGLTYFQLGDNLYFTVNGTYIIDIYEYASTTRKMGFAMGSAQDGGSGADGGFFANIMFPQTNAISAIYLRSNTAFDNGTYEVWGIK